MKTASRALCILSVAIAAAASAAEFPAKSISMIVPAPPGGGTDTFGRKVAEAAEKILKQQIVVENRGGGSGTVGIAQVLTAKPDGYTVGFVWNSPITTIPHSLEVPYTKADYSALMSIGYSSYVMCVAPDFPANSGAELIEAIRKNPGKYTVGNDGVGGTMQLAAERIFAKAGVKARHVPFKGAGETAKNFLGGHIDIYGGSIPPIQQHAKAGKAKCLLLTSAERNEALPQAAGLRDIGLAAEETVLWWGLIVPKKTPAAVQKKLEEVFLQAANTPDFKQVMANQGATTKPLNAADTNKLIDAEYAALEQVANAIGLKKAAK